jgi:phosphomevalonate kinase
VRFAALGSGYSSVPRAAKVGQDKNEFVESALRYGLTTALVLLGRTRFLDRLAAGLRIDLVAHRAFYSSPSPTGTDPEAPPRKTGLGSSAALVSALCGALLAYFGLVHLPDAGATKDEQLDSKDTTTRDLRLVHNLAQFAHFKAQGKIGSGFDVSSAVYGSHVYVRFDPIILQVRSISAFGQHINTAKRAGEKPEDIAELISGHWDSEVHALPLPSGLRLMLGDVSAGSKTPVMVSLVDAWRRGLEEEQRLGTKQSAFIIFAHYPFRRFPLAAPARVEYTVHSRVAECCAAVDERPRQTGARPARGRASFKGRPFVWCNRRSLLLRTVAGILSGGCFGGLTNNVYESTRTAQIYGT